MALITSISGIRGTWGGKPGQGLTPLDIVKFTSAFGSWILKKGGEPKIILGRDARPTGPLVSSIVATTLQSLGIEVVDLGLSTTPTIEMAVPGEQAGGGIIITASHNPINWNALKLLNSKGEFISGEDGRELLDLAEANDFSFKEYNQVGIYRQDNTWLDKHIESILALPLVDTKAIAAKKYRIVVDAVNSSGGFAVPKLLQALGVEQIIKLNCEPTGHFAHNPEPLPENLTQISMEMKKGDFHLGIVVDPDVDRLALVCEDGAMFGEEYTLVAISDYILKHNLGPTVSNLSSTRALADITRKAGQQYYSAAVGEVNVVAKMKEVGAVIGGEGNGGVIYPELHYGRDALVGIALFLSHLAKENKLMSTLLSSYPHYDMSKNKIELDGKVDLDAIMGAISSKYAKYPQNTEDGLKIDFEDQWVHLRRSNTEPIIRIYAEAGSDTTAKHLANKIITDIKEVLSA